MTGARTMKAGAADAEAIARLHERAFEPAWEVESLRGMLATPGSLALVVAVPEMPALAGFILCRSAADEAEIMMLAVDPDRRRRGLGRNLVEAAMTELARAGAGRLYLEVAIDNPAAQRLYAALGFGEVGRRPGYYHRPGVGPVDALVLLRPLTRA